MVTEEIKERIKLHLFKIQTLEISAVSKESIQRQREQLGAKILSTINGIESNGIKSELTLDLFMRMERGNDGRWAIVGFEINEVGPKVVQPLRPTVHNVITYNPLNTAKPKSIWRPRHKPYFGKPSPQSVFIIWVSYHGELTRHDQAFKLRFENRKM